PVLSRHGMVRSPRPNYLSVLRPVRLWLLAGTAYEALHFWSASSAFSWSSSDRSESSSAFSKRSASSPSSFRKQRASSSVAPSDTIAAISCSLTSLPPPSSPPQADSASANVRAPADRIAERRIRPTMLQLPPFVRHVAP